MEENGSGLSKICQSNPQRFPAIRTISDAISRSPELKMRYEIARQNRADALVEQSLDIADGLDGTDVARDKLRVTVRQWAAAKFAPNRYGDRIQVDGKLEGTQITQQMVINIGELSADARNALKGVLLEAKALEGPQEDED